MKIIVAFVLLAAGAASAAEVYQASEGYKQYQIHAAHGAGETVTIQLDHKQPIDSCNKFWLTGVEFRYLEGSTTKAVVEPIVSQTKRLCPGIVGSIQLQGSFEVTLLSGPVVYLLVPESVTLSVTSEP